MDQISLLPADEKLQYVAKISSVNLNHSPYEIAKTEWIDDVTLCPPVTFPNVYIYLIETPEFIHESLKAFKSLDAYNCVMSRWVRPLHVLKSKSDSRTSNVFVIIPGQVMLSQ